MASSYPIEPESDALAVPGQLLVGVRELRRSLSTFVRRAGAGETLIVTVDGKPVARLGPLQSQSPVMSLETLAQLGLIDRPRRNSEERGRAGDDASPPGPNETTPSDVRVDRLLRQVRG